MSQAIHNQRGQLVIEAVFLMIVFLGIVALAAATLKKSEYIAHIVQGPWVNLSGMFQNGMWASPAAGQPFHPSTHPRHITVKGDQAK